MNDSYELRPYLVTFKNRHNHNKITTAMIHASSMPEAERKTELDYGHILNIKELEPWEAANKTILF